MGAALTYARRYALFTLVGIAGEDDMDACDLATPTNRTSGSERPNGSGKGRLSSGQYDRAQRATPRSDAKVHSQARGAILGVEESAKLRDRLIAEVNDLGSSDDAAMWAHRGLSEKNKLIASDARRVEEAFQPTLASCVNGESDLPQTPTAPLTPKSQNAGKPTSRSKVIDKSVLALSQPRRIRDRYHVKSVAKHPCLVCGRRPSDAHHLRFAQNRALGRKVSDEFTVPLCRGHHREIHQCGDEAAWWRSAGFDPTVTARALWLETHPLPTSRVDARADL
jgi:hypothetical protein